ncbi:MAG: DUF4358 domain-containing protein [Clostridia bacterium]|nr:DUF4358 domain-containing protein [Clostridia bacterium]
MKLFFQKACALLLVLVLSLIFLFSCGENKQYADGVSCEELMNTAKSVISAELGYTDLGNEQILYYFGKTDGYNDVCLRYSVRSETIDEIGIFHSVNEERAQEIGEHSEKYLAQMKEEQGAFIASYAPKELSKLEKAEVRQFGNYTVYAILSEEDRQAVFQALEERLLIRSE